MTLSEYLSLPPIELLPAPHINAAPNGGCWIDGLLEGSMHHHHVIPRAFGGEHGPQVKICSACHDAIHDIAKKNMTVAQYLQNPEAKRALSFWSVTDQERANYLAAVIRKAEQTIRNSAHKRVTMSLNLSAQENDKLVALARRYGLSKENTLRRLLMEAPML